MSSKNMADLYFPISQTHYEMSLSFHTRCNLNCGFCFQTHKNEIDLNIMKNLTKKLEENYPAELKDPDLQSVRINIAGGELFFDDIPDTMFDIYRDTCNDLINMIRSKNKQDLVFNVTWGSNGVNTKHERILKLFNETSLEGVKQAIGLNYDPVGRYTSEEQFKMYQNTFWYFYNNYKHHPVVGFTLTKGNIDYFVNNTNDFIFNLPHDIEVDLCYYVANKNWKTDQPSDDDLFNFFKWAIDNNKFQLDGLNFILQTVYLNKPALTACICRRSIGYGGDEFIKDCRMFSLPLERYFENDINKITDENITEMKCLIGIEKRGCLSCEYKTLCTGPCWCSILFDEYKVSECPLKRTIQYLYDNPEIKNRYNTWNKERYII